MKCRRCNGRVFVDRTFTENRNYETFCILCGDRRFINKGTVLGKWIHEMEVKRENAAAR